MLGVFAGAANADVRVRFVAFGAFGGDGGIDEDVGYVHGTDLGGAGEGRVDVDVAGGGFERHFRGDGWCGV